MKIYDLDQLIRTDPTSFYDLTQLTHQSIANIPLIPYVIQSFEEMRIDLIAQSIYGNSDNMDVIIAVNHIDNPLNFLGGSTIYYPDASNVSLFRYNEQPTNTQVSQVINPTKSTRTDPARQQYVNQNYSLPPVTLNAPVQQVKINGNSLVIGNGLF